jgi:hypothetical protein
LFLNLGFCHSLEDWNDYIGMGVVNEYLKRLKMFPKTEAELEKAVLQELERISLEKLQCLREDLYTNLTKRMAACITKKQNPDDKPT